MSKNDWIISDRITNYFGPTFTSQSNTHRTFLTANSSVRLSARIAAAQLCGLLRVRSALPTLRSLSSDSSSPTPLRLAAQHAANEIEGR